MLKVILLLPFPDNKYVMLNLWNVQFKCIFYYLMLEPPDVNAILLNLIIKRDDFIYFYSESSFNLIYFT